MNERQLFRALGDVDDSLLEAAERLPHRKKPRHTGLWIAACLCLEGYNTVGESLYFVNPDRGDGSWFEASLRLVISIGDHDFYM